MRIRLRYRYRYMFNLLWPWIIVGIGYRNSKGRYESAIRLAKYLPNNTEEIKHHFAMMTLFETISIVLFALWLFAVVIGLFKLKLNGFITYDPNGNTSWSENF